MKKTMVRKGLAILRYERYADDFVILVKGTKEQAEQALTKRRELVRTDLRMELAEEKTGLPYLEEGFDFLGFRIWMGELLPMGLDIQDLLQNGLLCLGSSTKMAQE